MTNPTIEKRINDLCQQKAALLKENENLGHEAYSIKVMKAKNDKRIKLIDEEIQELQPKEGRTVIPDPAPPIQVRH